MKKQNGFTLIELIVVIVILGILSITAAPKFLNIQSDAKVAAFSGLKGAMDSAASMPYAKSVIKGADSEPYSFIEDIRTSFGYPDASEEGIGNAVIGLSQDDGDWELVPGSATGISISYQFPENKKAGCILTYELYQPLNDNFSDSTSERPLISIPSVSDC